MVSRSSQYQHLLWAANVHSPGCCVYELGYEQKICEDLSSNVEESNAVQRVVIDFNRINKIGFDCEVLLDDGISEAVESLKYLINTGEFEKFKNLTCSVVLGNYFTFQYRISNIA